MKLLFTYDNREDGEAALAILAGPKRLASERDGANTVYNLFGQPTWVNFYKLGLYDLQELRDIVEARRKGLVTDASRHSSILETVKYVAKQNALEIPDHWR